MSIKTLPKSLVDAAMKVIKDEKSKSDESLPKAYQMAAIKSAKELKGIMLFEERVTIMKKNLSLANRSYKAENGGEIFMMDKDRLDSFDHLITENLKITVESDVEGDSATSFFSNLQGGIKEKAKSPTRRKRIKKEGIEDINKAKKEKERGNDDDDDDDDDDDGNDKEKNHGDDDGEDDKEKNHGDDEKDSIDKKKSHIPKPTDKKKNKGNSKEINTDPKLGEEVTEQDRINVRELLASTEI